MTADYKKNPKGNRFCFNSKGINFIKIFFLMTILLQSLHNVVIVQGKGLQSAKKTLNLLRDSGAAALQLRYKRDTFTNEEQQQMQGHDYEEHYDENYDVLPDGNSQSPTLEEQIAERAKQISESFTKMWQSLTDSIGHCFDALRGIFADDVQREELTPDQQQQQSQENIKANYYAKHERDNYVSANDLEN